MKILFTLMVLFVAIPTIAVGTEPPVKMYRYQVSVKDESGWYPAISTGGSFKAIMPLPFNDFSIKAKDPNVDNIWKMLSLQCTPVNYLQY